MYIKSPLKFMLRNLIPHIDKATSNMDYANFLLDHAFCLTNINKENIVDFIKNMNSEGLFKGFNISNPQKYVDNNVLFLNPYSFYSSAKLEFSIERNVAYEQIFNIKEYLGLLDNPLINYSLMAGGSQIGDTISAFGGSVIHKISEGKSFDEMNSGQQHITTFISDITRVSSVIGKTVTDVISSIIDTIKYIGVETSEGLSLTNQYFYTQNGTFKSRAEIHENGTKAFSLASIFTAKLFSKVEEPFPKITLNINNIAYSSVDEHIPLINFLQKLVTPLTLAMPIYPVQLVIFNEHDTPEETNYDNYYANRIRFDKGLPPFTYLQSNVGYFNVTGITIKDLGLGYGTSDSDFFASSGIPIPIGLSVKIELQAFDPYYFNFFDPSTIFKRSAEGAGDVNTIFTDTLSNMYPNTSNFMNKNNPFTKFDVYTTNFEELVKNLSEENIPESTFDFTKKNSIFNIKTDNNNLGNNSSGSGNNLINFKTDSHHEQG